MSEFITNDNLFELKAENERLLNENKVISDLLEKYRKCLLNFQNICFCNQKSNNNVLVKSLENTYQKVFSGKKRVIPVEEKSIEFKCCYKGCGIVCKNQIELKNHIRDKHTSNKPFRCEECNSCFAKQLDLSSHKLHFHSVNKETLNVDNSCDKTVQKRGNTSMTKSPNIVVLNVNQEIDCNQQNIEEKAIKGTHTLSYKCDDCDQCFYHNSRLVKHQLIHTNDKQLSIDSNVSDKSEDILKVSVNKTGNKVIILNKSNPKINPKSSDNRFQCEECHQIMTTAYTLAQHKRLCHESEAVYYKCGQCDYKSKLEVEFRQHLLDSHSISKYSFCQYCGKRFARVYGLAQHIRRAHGGGYKCNKCEQCFSTEIILRRHMSKHNVPLEPSKQFKCNLYGCDQSFSSFSALYKHKHKHSYVN